MAYLLDSDVFIQASNLHYQFAFCSAFWDWIDREYSTGKLISIDRVLKEIREGQFGELKPWAEARPHLFVKSADVETAECNTRVALWVSQNYDEAGYEKFFRGADFVLVGYALAHNHIVVTQENARGGKAKVKIPDACDAMGVKCINTWDLLKSECPKFVLG
jgi:Domain of unknown function (DUF4411)